MIDPNHKYVKLKKVCRKEGSVFSLWNLKPGAVLNVFYIAKDTNMKNNNFSTSSKLPRAIPFDLLKIEFVLFHRSTDIHHHKKPFGRFFWPPIKIFASLATFKTPNEIMVLFGVKS